MTDKLQYKLSVGVSDDIDVEEFEDFLQSLLLDLYEDGGVESIRVTKDGHTKTADENMNELLSIIEQLDSEQLQRAIETVQKMEQFDEEE